MNMRKFLRLNSSASAKRPVRAAGSCVVIDPSSPTRPDVDADADGTIVRGDLVIKGVTRSGRTFRPSDWADRLCGVMSAFGSDEQLRYSPLVAPALRDGIRCVIVRGELARLEPRLYRFFLGFALDNELQVSFDADAVATLLPDALRRMASEPRSRHRADASGQKEDY